MSLATGKQFHSFIWEDLPINDQVMQRVSDLTTKENQLEITKGHPIFKWIPGIPIIDKDDKNQNEDDEIAPSHGDEDDYEIPKNEEGEKITEEETYDQE